MLEVRPADASRLPAVAGVLQILAARTPAADPGSRLLTVPVRDRTLVAEAVRRLDHAAIALDELALRRPSLDEVFLTLTGSRPPSEPADIEERIAV